MAAQIQHVLYVIESPSPRDILEDRREGYALVSALRLADIPNKYFAVSDLETFTASIDNIANAPASKKRIIKGQIASEVLFVPTIHISVHGNEDGISLTDGTLILWDKLAGLLDRINKVKGYIGKKNPRGYMALSLSCCRGSNAKSMLKENEPWPVFAIVGSEQDIAWTDSLTAWVVFYHLFITKDFSAEKALKRMNLAAGNDDAAIFQIYK